METGLLKDVGKFVNIVFLYKLFHVFVFIISVVIMQAFLPEYGCVLAGPFVKLFVFILLSNH